MLTGLYWINELMHNEACISFTFRLYDKIVVKNEKTELGTYRVNDYCEFRNTVEEHGWVLVPVCSNSTGNVRLEEDQTHEKAMFSDY